MLILNNICIFLLITILMIKIAKYELILQRVTFFPVKWTFLYEETKRFKTHPWDYSPFQDGSNDVWKLDKCVQKKYLIGLREQRVTGLLGGLVDRGENGDSDEMEWNLLHLLSFRCWIWIK